MSTPDISTTLKTQRLKLRLTQDKVAELAGISKRAYCSMEYPNSNPQLSNLLAVMQVLGLELRIDIANNNN